MSDRLSVAIRRYQREVDQFDQALAGFLGVNRTDLRCLDFLVEAPRSARDLARATGLTPSAITTAIDRLEHLGYVERTRGAVDRRRILVEPTHGGTAQARRSPVRLCRRGRGGHGGLQRERGGVARDVLRAGLGPPHPARGPATRTDP
ncbi:MarR family winged helix-turn-helix transcriptional regulator [Actinoplanes nipponensis]|uniref:MarR family winged helix-turn-helix transcriptional regulator n=1 Tax=Actinoplanes nipponensis TaxID=135950 RepID=UPI0034DB3480